jgi:murein DD-endopeptidase MepM/ murein hydrolase activator NlpD
MKLVIAFFLLTTNAAFAQLDNASIRDLKSGRVTRDSSFVYTLPYEPGKSYLLIQAYNSKLSHQNELALDFKMKPGTKICAARGGIVESTRKDSDIGGLKDEYFSEANHIVIVHSDGSRAYYWHLQKDGVFVNDGDTVMQGQLIGRSGNTGYSAFPHLHFEVAGNSGQIPTRFYTRKGIRYLRPGEWYKRVHAQLK